MRQRFRRQEDPPSGRIFLFLADGKGWLMQQPLGISHGVARGSFDSFVLVLRMAFDFGNYKVRAVRCDPVVHELPGFRQEVNIVVVSHAGRVAEEFLQIPNAV